MLKKFKAKRNIRKDLVVKYIGIIIIMIFVIKMFMNLFLYIPPSFTFSNKKIYSIKKYFFDNTVNNPLKMLGVKTYTKEDTIELKYQVNKLKSKKYSIYIYNTHQKEEYLGNKTVLDASKYMANKLNNININTLVEQNNIIEFMRINNMSYEYSYNASRYYIKNNLKNNYDLIIDLHRDSLDKNAVTLVTKNKKYAKVLFVIGGENKSYKYNYKVAQSINNKIKKKYPKLTRGIIIKSGKGVNGVYNQDLAKNIILIEIGSNKSNYDEVKNTIDLIVPIIGDYLNEI